MEPREMKLKMEPTSPSKLKMEPRETKLYSSALSHEEFFDEQSTKLNNIICTSSDDDSLPDYSFYSCNPFSRYSLFDSSPSKPKMEPIFNEDSSHSTEKRNSRLFGQENKLKCECIDPENKKHGTSSESMKQIFNEDIKRIIDEEAKTCLEYISKNKLKHAYEILSKLEEMSDTVEIKFNDVIYKEEFIKILINLIPVENINGIERDRLDLLILMLTIFCDFSDSSNEFRKYLYDHDCFVDKIIGFIKMLLENRKLVSINNQLLELSTFITYNLYSNNTGTNMPFYFEFDIKDKHINVQTKIALCGTNIYNQYLNDEYILFLKNVLCGNNGHYEPFTESEINNCLNKYKEDVELKKGIEDIKKKERNFKNAIDENKMQNEGYTKNNNSLKKIEEEYKRIEELEIKDAEVSNFLHIYEY